MRVTALVVSPSTNWTTPPAARVTEVGSSSAMAPVAAPAPGAAATVALTGLDNVTVTLSSGSSASSPFTSMTISAAVSPAATATQASSGSMAT